MLELRAGGDPVDDASGRIVYDPLSAWTTETSFGVYSTNNNTISTSSTANSTASLRFKGSSIQVACLTWPTGANVSIYIDGVQKAIVSTGAASPMLATPKAIWSSDRLNTGVAHTIMIKKVQDDPTWISPIVGDSVSHLYLDSFTIGGPIDGSTSPARVNMEVIVYSVFGGLAVIVLVAFFWCIRSRRKRTQLPPISSVTPFEEGESVVSPYNEVTRLNQFTTTEISSNTTPAGMGPTRNEKARPAMAGGYDSEAESSSRGRRWRSSLIALPRGRVLRVASARVPPEGLPELVSSEVGTGTTEAQSHLERVVKHTASPTSRLSSASPEANFPLMPESSATPSSVPPAPSASSPGALSPHLSPARTSLTTTTTTPQTIPRSGEKAVFPGIQGDGNEIGTACMLFPTTTNALGSSNSHQTLLREVNALRAQVQQLSRQTYSHGLERDVDPGEPPPEYEGRDESSEEERDHHTRSR